SGRAKKPFVAVNCAAIPEALLESELFGHVRGAFTGATSDRTGIFQEANGGTLLLDEIAEMSAPLQAKLLTVLEEGRIRPVGSSKEGTRDARAPGATPRDLRARVSRGLSREDLLYRLDVASVEIPPLRHRREDIPTLTAHFLAAARGRSPRSALERVSPAVM